MYILMISRGYPEPKEPQWGNFERDQAEALVALGHKVVMASVDGRFRLKWRKLGTTHFEKNGVEVYGSFLLPDKVLSILNKRMAFVFFVWQLKRLYKYIERECGKPDIIYSHYMFNSAAAVELKKKHALPLVAIEHWSQLNVDTLPTQIQEIGSYTYKNCDKIITVSNSLSNRIKRHFSKDSVVINNMLNEAYLGEKVKLKDSNVKFNFVSIGSLIPRKAFDILLDAFGLANFDKNVTLSIIGKGELYTVLQNKIMDLGLQENVFLLGSKTKEEIKEKLNESDAFVLPSKIETFGVVIIEALSAGLPCVATVCGGPEEILSKSNGLLVEPEDTVALANAMLQILKNYTLYDKQRIAYDCKARYAPNVIAKQLAKVFEEVIEGK